MDDGVVTGTRAPRWGSHQALAGPRRAEAALVGGTADPAAFRRAAAQRGQGLTSPSGRSCAAASTACREAVVTAVNTPSHGWTAQPRSPGRGRLLGGDQPACNGTCLAVVGPTIASGRSRSTPTASRAADGVLACAHPRGPPENRCPPSLLPWLAGGAARAESFVAMQDDVVHYAGQPVGHNRRRGVRISPVRRLAGARGVRTAPSVTGIEWRRN